MTTPSDSINPMAEALLAFSETMSCITDAVTGYRAQLEAAGFDITNEFGGQPLVGWAHRIQPREHIWSSEAIHPAAHKEPV